MSGAVSSSSVGLRGAAASATDFFPAVLATFSGVAVAAEMNEVTSRTAVDSVDDEMAARADDATDATAMRSSWICAVSSIGIGTDFARFAADCMSARLNHNEGRPTDRERARRARSCKRAASRRSRRTP